MSGIKLFMEFNCLNFLLCIVLTISITFSPKVSEAQEQADKKDSYSTNMSRYKSHKKDFMKRRYASYGGSIVLMNYFGDLTPETSIVSTDFGQMKAGVSAFLQYRYTPSVSLRAELLYGRLVADDYRSPDPGDPEVSYRYIRNLSFRNDIFELSFTGQYHIFKNYLDFAKRKTFNLYFLAGFGLFYHNPKARVPDYKLDGSRFSNSGEWVALRPLGTEGQFSEHYDVKPYSRFQLNFPVGGGISIKLTQRLDLQVELAYRYLITDYLDDVGGQYVDLGALDNDLAKALANRSQEEYASITGEKRDLNYIEQNTSLQSYISPYDGNIYNEYKGYGRGNIRGGDSNDAYIVTSFKISYIFTNSKKRETN